MTRLIAVLATLFAAACCSRLPKLPAKAGAFPPLPSAAPVTEESAVWRDEQRARDVPVKIYAPAAARGRLPVVVFSHGIGEDRDSYAWLGRALAGAGFLTVHITHAGTDRATLERGYRHLYRAVKQRESWVNRVLDIPFVLDRLAPREDADVTRSAVVGHSAGAFAAFALAGMRTIDGHTARDARVIAAVPMSMPRLDGVIGARGYDEVAVPVLNITGTCDTSLIYRTFPKHRRIPFDESRAERQYLATLDGANHDSFVIEDRHRDAIVALTAGFLRAFVLDDAVTRRWFDEAGRAPVGGSVVALER